MLKGHLFSLLSVIAQRIVNYFSVLGSVLVVWINCWLFAGPKGIKSVEEPHPKCLMLHM